MDFAGSHILSVERFERADIERLSQDVILQIVNEATSRDDAAFGRLVDRRLTDAFKRANPVAAARVALLVGDRASAERWADLAFQLAVFEAMGPFASENEDVTNRMLEAIGYGDISIRQAACEALGEARCKAAVPDLIKALHNFFLRPRASDALKRIGDRKGFLAIKRLQIREKLFKKPKGRAAPAKGKAKK